MEELRHNPQTSHDHNDTTATHTSTQDSRRETQRDEDAALRSLDITSTRIMPDPVPIWETSESVEAAPTATPHHRIATIALVCVVGVVCFVAGGMTARFAAQMPLLFPEKTEHAEVTATYAPAIPESDTQETPVEYSEPSPAPNTSLERNGTAPDATEESPTTSEPRYRWDFDSEGDRSLSYDTEDNRVTLDYDGYLFSMNLDKLMAEPDDDTSQTTTEPEAYDQYLYDDSTGYDTTYDRDVYGWTRQVWGGNWT